MSLDYFIAPDHYVTDRFLLRCYRPGDGRLMTQAVTSSYEHLRPFMAWASADQTVEEAEKLARRFRANYLTNEDFVLGIFSPDERRVLGGTGFHLREGDLANQSAEIGMWIRASEAGQGLGSAVLRGLLHWGFTAWPWERLSWRCSGRNAASRRTALRVGLREEGVLLGYSRLPDGSRDDMYCFGILRDEWRSQQPREDG